MTRKIFLRVSACMMGSFLVQYRLSANSFTVQTKTFYFKDDSVIPNSKYPLVIYQQAFNANGNKGADWLEDIFATNKWTNSWRWGVYPFHHYHSNTHEVLGVFKGDALLHMGGEKGEKMKVYAGDIIVIPAGVGHKCLEHTDDFTVVGAYPNGLSPDLMKGNAGERPAADENIARVQLPVTDPVSGKKSGILSLWK